MTTNLTRTHDEAPATTVSEPKARVPVSPTSRALTDEDKGAPVSIDAPPDLYMFRFRDLGAETLKEHRQIIDAQGACWWGWWKRPTEPTRHEVWDELTRLTAGDGSAVIALYDTGTQLARLARVTAVLKPQLGNDDRPTSFNPVDDHLVPQYYRGGQACRAWLKLTEINVQPMDLFDAWSYATPPPLPGLGAGQLAQIKDKRVASAHELASMDTTVWHIRRSRPSDRKESFLTPRMHLGEPVSPKPVHCAGDWLLHVTDLHFSSPPNRDRHAWPYAGEGKQSESTALESIAKAIRNSKHQVGAVAITGDFTFTASKEEFTTARQELFRFVTGDLNLEMDNLVVMPGNHDIAWSTDAAYSPNAEVTVAPDKATAAYREFFHELYRYEASDGLTMGRRFVFPNAAVIDIACLNSSSLEQGRHFLAGMGRIEEGSFADVIHALRWHERTDSLRVLALHHHLALVEDVAPEGEYYTGFGIAADAPRVLRLAADSGVSLALHGHRHTPFVGRVYAHELPDTASEHWDHGSVNILGGGSAGSTDVRSNWHHFNLLRYDGWELRAEVYRSANRGMYQRIGTWVAQVDRSHNRAPVLGPWQRDNGRAS